MKVLSQDVSPIRRIQRSERGQTLAMFALTVASVISIVVMAVGMNTMQPRPNYTMTLQQAVDAAALAGSAEFRRNYIHQDMVDAVTNSLTSNGVVSQSIDVETCSTTPTDPDLCPTVSESPRKLVRVRVTALVDNVSTEAISIAEAPSLDVVLLIQRSESMTFGSADPAYYDPSVCNPHGCHPFEEVKNAADDFADNLYFPYDRVSVVTFDQIASLDFPLSDEAGGDTVTPALAALTVYDPGQCAYKLEDLFALSDPITAPVPPYYDPGSPDYGDPKKPCRLYDTAGTYQQFFNCPMFHATDINGNRTSANDPSWCGTTNSAAGLVMAKNHLLGAYPIGWTGEVRPHAEQVIVMVSTGAPNSAQNDNGQAICPMSSRGSNYDRAGCRDREVIARHCFQTTDLTCLNSTYDVDGTHTILSTYDPTNYDVYDRAFDLVDVVASHNIQIYTVGLGAQVNAIVGDVNGLAPGAVFLQYAAHTTDGTYTYAPDSSALSTSLGQIAETILGTGFTVVTEPTPTPTVTATETSIFTPSATNTPACASISFAGNFSQAGGFPPRLSINISNANDQDIRLTDFSFDWAAYHAVNPSQFGTSWDFTGGFANGSDWLTSPFNWSNASGPIIPANSTANLRFTFENADAGWPGNISASSFGLTATFNDQCTISLNPSPTSTPTVTPTRTVTPTPTITRTASHTLTPTPSSLIVQSISGQDGWMLESSETSGVGGSIDATSGGLRLGDDGLNRQYRGLLSFDTSSLPDTAVITSVVLKVKVAAGALIGSNPFEKLGSLWIDLRKGTFGTKALVVADFSAPASLQVGGAFNETPASGWYTATLKPSAFNTLNKTGLTQLRLRFGLDDNNNNVADYITFYSSNISVVAYRPVLEIRYRYP